MDNDVPLDTPTALLTFACALEPSRAELVDEIVCEYSRGYTEIFLERLGGELEGRTEGLVQFLRSWTASDLTVDAAWDLSSGCVRRAVLSGEADAVEAAVLLALHLHSRGIAGEWSARAPEPFRPKWAQLLLPRTAHLTVAGGDGVFAAGWTDTFGSRVDATIRREGAEWTAEYGRKLPQCHVVSHDVCMLDHDSVNALRLGPWFDDVSRSFVREVTRPMSEAIDLMREHAPLHLQWVDKVVGHVVPLSGDRGLRSSSSDQLPGTIGMSFPARLVAIGEMLVHEASHQYLHILSRLLPVHDGSDTSLYYSPVKGHGRPIGAILLAFHAFANVVLFYQSCIESGLKDEGYCEANMERHLPELELMASHLRSTHSLTEAGRLLWQPLAARLAAVGNP